MRRSFTLDCEDWPRYSPCVPRIHLKSINLDEQVHYAFNLWPRTEATRTDSGESESLFRITTPPPCDALEICNSLYCQYQRERRIHLCEHSEVDRESNESHTQSSHLYSFHHQGKRGVMNTVWINIRMNTGQSCLGRP